eukprot:TRINITY_DN2684_c0_g1_i10.p1 TRINITY_DN2684_c0_g1~~TRINITY_DN2684_c0_g1_i10.p1  ORF type:complete len:134 (+),score=21.69 TRINITY_DN2684_c0_g1_i10:589-990(+)
MRERMFQGRFGQCPRVFCQAQNTVPIGLSDDLKVSRVKIFCPKCGDVYVPKKKCADVDGAYFGSAFPHILLYVTDFLLAFQQSRPILIYPQSHQSWASKQRSMGSSCIKRLKQSNFPFLRRNQHQERRMKNYK